MDKFDLYYRDLCKVNAAMSKDPSTKVGAVIIRPDRTIASMGWNGFPKGADDAASNYENRDFKYPNIIHAELNAILHSREPLHGYSICVWPLPPCERCMACIIQSGISMVYAPRLADDHRWYATGVTAQEQAFLSGLKYMDYTDD